MAPGPDRPGATAALFGLGLIGGRVAGFLRGAGYAAETGLPFAWGSPPTRSRELADIRTALAAAPGRLDVIWSAGSGGFGMDRAQSDLEFADFSRVLDMARVLAAARPPGRTRFHLLSSAGGLFEGQRHVTPESVPAPRRCYGILKLRQETALAGVAELVRLVYRPSSVYGPAAPGRRMGLIPTLLANGAGYRVSTIYGAPDTLRDYVAASDVARYVAHRAADGNAASETMILAAARPTSLSQVMHAVERTTGRKLYVTYRTDATNNTAHITFSRRTWPRDWRPGDMETGIRRLWRYYGH